MWKPRFSPRNEIKNRSVEGLLWGPAQNNRLAGLWARPRTRPSEETSWPRQSLFRPTEAKKTCLRSNSSSDIAKSGSKVRPSHCSPSSKHVKKEGNLKYLIKGCHHHINCITTTLLAALMRRRPLNSATSATATHKELIRVFDGIGAQVGVWMINKCKA